MVDKFPALDETEIPNGVDGGDDGDFLSREKELLGDEFKTEQDQDVWAEDDEISEFKDQFPEVDNAPANEVEEEPYNFEKSSNVKDLGESVSLKEWKERRDLELSERSRVNQKTKEGITSKARQTLDDFYDNYNSKKKQHSSQVLDDEKAFLERRDGFLKRGTLWDRVDELVREVGEIPSADDRDKSRFKRILKNLQGKEDVPGAGGYQ